MPGGYHCNRCHKLYRPWRTIWCWGFWFGKWLYKVDEVRFFSRLNIILHSAFIQKSFMEVDLCKCHDATWPAKLENAKGRKCFQISHASIVCFNKFSWFFRFLSIQLWVTYEPAVLAIRNFDFHKIVKLSIFLCASTDLILSYPLIEISQVNFWFSISQETAVIS